MIRHLVAKFDWHLSTCFNSGDADDDHDDGVGIMLFLHLPRKLEIGKLLPELINQKRHTPVQ